jgi:hypothetical protein
MPLSGICTRETETTTGPPSTSAEYNARESAVQSFASKNAAVSP